jgi:hypothetical protein
VRSNPGFRSSPRGFPRGELGARRGR